MNMGAMNPAMIQQMQQMQMKQMAAAMGGAGPGSPQQGQQPGGGSMSPNPASPGAQQQGLPNMMNAAMMQQMQGQPQGQQPQGGAGAGPQGPGAGNEGASPGAGYNRQQQPGGPGYNAQEQIAFEQQKYEQQQARRVMDTSRGFSPYQQGGPTSWEGMYDEVPQPNIPTGPQGMVRGGSMGRGMCFPLIRFQPNLSISTSPTNIPSFPSLYTQAQPLNQVLPPPTHPQAPVTPANQARIIAAEAVVDTVDSTLILGRRKRKESQVCGWDYIWIRIRI